MKHPIRVTVAVFVLVILTGSFATMTSGSARPAAPHERPSSSEPQPQAVTKVYLSLISAVKWIRNVGDGDRVARTITVIGAYPQNLVEDLWVFVVPQNGRYYPQSLNTCERARTPKVNGQWEMRVGLGVDNSTGQTFTIILTKATPQASQFIEDTLYAWCQANNYPGLTQLPPGVTALDQVRVVRTAELWGSAPPITNTYLQGQVTITQPTQGQMIPQTMTARGTYSPAATDNIWVLIYATNGRWYPQSQNACAGLHTQKSNGQWQVPVQFGGPQNVGEPFDIAVVLADAQASAALHQKQREWCIANNYLGWLTIELPQGIEEQVRIRVYRI